MNYPLRDGIDDESYEAIFKPVSALAHPLGCVGIDEGDDSKASVMAEREVVPPSGYLERKCLQLWLLCGIRKQPHNLLLPSVCESGLLLTVQ